VKKTKIFALVGDINLTLPHPDNCFGLADLGQRMLERNTTVSRKVVVPTIYEASYRGLNIG
jgi:hypothetical protein